MDRYSTGESQPALRTTHRLLNSEEVPTACIITFSWYESFTLRFVCPRRHGPQHSPPSLSTANVNHSPIPRSSIAFLRQRKPRTLIDFSRTFARLMPCGGVSLSKGNRRENRREVIRIQKEKSYAC